MAKAIIILELDMADDSPLLPNIAHTAAKAVHEAAPAEMVTKIRLGIAETADIVLSCFDDLDKPERHYKMGGES